MPPAVWWLCGLQLLLLVWQSLLVPTWRGPDEPNHADLVIALREGWHYPGYDERSLDPGIRASLALFDFGHDSRNLTAGEARPRTHRLTRGDLTNKGITMDLRVMGRPGTRNHMPQHPPGYYMLVAWLAAGADTVLPGDGFGSVDQEVGALRLLSLLVAVPLPLVAWWVARRAGAGPAGALAAAVVPLAVPQLTHIAAVVNSDALLVLLCGVLTAIVLRVAQGAVDTGTMVVAGLVTGAALFVKALAFVLPVWVLIAFAAGWRRGDRPMPKHLRGADRRWPPWAPPVAAYAGTAVVAGGWWWIRNLVVHGDISPSIEYATRLDTPAAADAPGAIDWGRWASDVVQRYWGAFGWIDVAVPETAVVVASAVVVVGVALALLPSRRRPVRARRAASAASATAAASNGSSEPGRSDAGSPLPPAVVGVLVAPTLLLAAFVAGNTYRLYQPGRVLAMVQGRYLFGGLIGLAVVVAVGWSRLGRRWVPPAFLVAALALQTAAVLAMLRYWWGPPRGSLGDQLAALGAWSPWPAGVVGIVAGLTVGVAGVSVWAVIRDSWSSLASAPVMPVVSTEASPAAPTTAADSEQDESHNAHV